MRYKAIMITILMMLLSTLSPVFADGNWTVDLVAGQNETIGTVNYAITGDTLTATYSINSPGWCITTTHLYVNNTAPSTHAPGQFQYKHENLDCVTSDVFTVPTLQGDVFVAAHADADYDPNRANDQDLIGDEGQLTVNNGTGSYFDASVDVLGLVDQYEAWCVDLEHFITPGVTYDVDVFEEGNALVDKPDRLDSVLYLVNQDYSAIGATADDVQTAIWVLIDDIFVYQSPVVQQMVDDALTNGDGFVPGCGQLAGVFMDPGPDVQNIMVMVPVVCADGNARGETAWGLADWGTPFNQAWGMYFQLVDAPDADPSPEPPATEAPPTDDPTQEPPATEAPPTDDPTQEPPATQAPPQDTSSNDNDNRSRRDEAPGQNPDNDAPGSRADESRGNGNGNSNSNRGK